jgi:membrane protein
VTSPIDRLNAAVQRLVNAARSRSRALDHLIRAAIRYDDVLGGRLAAAIAYYGFFAVFALTLIGYSIFGMLLRYNFDLRNLLSDFLRANLPFLDVAAVRDSGNAVGIVGLVGLVLTGIGWIETIRSSQRLIWRLDQHPGNFILRRLVDLVVMVGVLLLVLISFGAAYAIELFLQWASGGRVPFLLAAVSWVLTVAVNMLLAAALLVAVPRLRMTARRLAPAVLLVGTGITLLNTVGRTFVGLVQHNPAYALVVSAVGLLVYLYVFNQLLLFGAAWAATSKHGPVMDYSGDQVEPPPPPGPVPAPEPKPERGLDSEKPVDQR